MPSAGAQWAGLERLCVPLRKLSRPLSPVAQQEPKWVSLEASKKLVCIPPETHTKRLITKMSWLNKGTRQAIVKGRKRKSKDKITWDQMVVP